MGLGEHALAMCALRARMPGAGLLLLSSINGLFFFFLGFFSGHHRSPASPMHGTRIVDTESEKKNMKKKSIRKYSSRAGRACHVRAS